MFKSMLRRSVPALTLATILFTTCAGTAQARTLTPAEQAWSWLRQVWTEGVGLWGGGTEGIRERDSHSTRQLEKGLTGIAPPSSSSPPPSSTTSDGGYGSDPNGRS